MPDSQIEVVYITLLIAAAVIDVKNRIIPDSLCVAIALLSISTFGVDNALGILAALPFFIAAVITDKIGGGDVKFIMANGLLLGFERCVCGQIISLLPILVYYIVQKLNKSQAEQGKSIPLAPFFTFGFMIANFI